MIGSITKAIVESLRASEIIDAENISVVIANDDGEGTVNTALPAIAVAIKGSENSNTGEFIGGTITDEYIVQLAVIINFDNQAAADDEDFQYSQMDLANDIKLYMAKSFYSEYFKELRENYDFSMSYKGKETEQKRAMERELGEVDVFIFRLIYCCKTIQKSMLERPGAILPENVVIMQCGCNEE